MKKMMRFAIAALAIVCGMNSCQKVSVESISLDPSLTLYVDSSYKMVAKVTPEDAKIKVSWNSNNSAIATVDADGVVKGIKKGKTTIIATSGEKAAASEVIVVDPVTLQLTLKGVSQKKCTVSIAASDDEGYYYCGFAEKAQVDKLADTAIINSIMYSLDYVIQVYAKLGQKITLTDLLKKGSGNLIANGMTANTDYVMFGFGIDVDTKLPSPVLTRMNFKTAAVVPSSNTFSIKYDSITVSGTTTLTKKAWFTVTPSVTADKYIVQIIDKHVLDSLFSGSAKEYYDYAEEYYDKNYSSYGGMDLLASAGKRSVSMSKPVEGTTYQVMVVGYNGGFTTDITTYDWTYNVQAPAKPARLMIPETEDEMIVAPFKPLSKEIFHIVK